jgi:sugar O-acyltransferase (sialic acid O-acetyltransferase NeuD family)
MADSLVIIGAGGHGKVVADIAIAMNKWRYILFLDDQVIGTTSTGVKVVGKLDQVPHFKDKADFVIAIGDNAYRQKLQDDLETNSYSIAKLIHPNAVIGSSVAIGDGTVVTAGAVINNGARIGKGCIINTSSSIDHECVIDDYVHISPGVHLAGNVRIGKKCWLGIGSSVINNIGICNECIIGAGGVVIYEITEPGTYVGVPAKKTN